MKQKTMNKKGVVSGMVAGIIGLIFTVVIGFVLIATVLDASLMKQGGTDKGAFENISSNLALNLSDGVQAIGNKIPTILLIAIVVILFGALALLVLQGRRMGMFGGGGGF